MDQESTIQKLVQLGLSEQKAKETIKNANVTKNLISAIDLCSSATLPEGAGLLIYHMCTKIKPQITHQLKFLVNYIVEKKLDTSIRVDAALEYLLTHGTHKDFNVGEFEKACGVGIVVTPEEIEQNVEKVMAKYKEDLIQQRYRFNVGKILQDMRGLLPWADGKALKNEVDVQIFDLLGPKNEADLAPPPKADKKSKPKPTVEKEVKKADEPVKDGANSISELMKYIQFHAPGENYKTDGYVVTEKTHGILKEHLKTTGGQVRTRFPPEPNGILHIGHAKAININFGYAAAKNGVCFLRFDDTNPEKEEEKFFLGIKDMVDWLGYK